jgi:anthranilate synthase/aminodeoxychorismate synthase-like glutamine amidotransferase
MIIVIDNYDSFVYNLVQFLGETGEDVVVIRNDQVRIRKVVRDMPSAIIVSPGPGIPRHAGKTCDVIRACAGHIPILGVCLGHQAIADTFGGRIIQAPQVVHGKLSCIHHDGSWLFRGIEDPFVATRYHSLIVDTKTLPSCLCVTAWTNDGTIMGIRHKEYRMEGFQFHPESILTVCGKRLVKNFLKGAVRENHPV